MTRKPTPLLALVIALFGASVARAEVPLPLKPDADLDTVLDALHARGQGLKDFAADVKLSTFDNRTGEATDQIGKVVFQERDGGNSRIKVVFDTRKLETGATLKEKLEYLLENGWLTDRNYTKKIEVRRQVLRPGQKMNLLKLGEGPFPLPIGQPREEVKKQFEVKLVPRSKDDPADTAHLKLIPAKGTSFAKRFKEIDVYVDRKTAWPGRIDTTETAGTARSTELTNVKLNPGVNDEAFSMSNIDNAGWNRKEEPYQQ